jgi:hypothetical protein
VPVDFLKKVFAMSLNIGTCWQTMQKYSKAIDVYLKCLDMLMEQDTGEGAKQGNTTQKGKKSLRSLSAASAAALFLLMIWIWTNGRCSRRRSREEFH